MANRFDGSVVSELLPQSPHAHFDDVRPRVEVVPPHLSEQTLAADHLARVEHQLSE
jgi:hypothetical protein